MGKHQYGHCVTWSLKRKIKKFNKWWLKNYPEIRQKEKKEKKGKHRKEKRKRRGQEEEKKKKNDP